MLTADSTTQSKLLKQLRTSPQPSKHTTMVEREANSDWQVDTVKVAKTKNILLWKAPKPLNLRTIKFAEEGYFKGNKYFRPELVKAHDGVLGDPAPYNVGNDNVVAGTLIVCFALAMIASSMSRNFIARQIKNLFHRPTRSANIVETGHEVRFQAFLVVQTALLLSITYYLFTRTTNSGNDICDSPILAVGIFFGIFLSYFLLKNLLYTIVNWVYFDRRSNQQWSQLTLFLVSAEGVIIYPAVLLMIYFGLSAQYTLIYAATIVSLIKLLLFYQGYIIFFKRTAVSMQIILYFCTLELMPLMALVGILVYTNNYLTIIF